MNTTAEFAVALLVHYSFDLGGYTAGELIDHWLKDYSATWVCQGVVEALYQGRYKAVSVEQILVFWNRRGQPLYHHNHEFERLICGNVTIGFKSGDDDSVVVKASGTGEETPVQLVNATTNVPHRRSIEQFTPTADCSDFHIKLKTIAQHNHRSQESGVRSQESQPLRDSE